MRDPTARRLLRESRAARPALAFTGILGLLSAALTLAQAALLAAVLAEAFMDGASLASLRGELIALACVIAGRAAVAAGFEVGGRAGALRVMAQLRHRLAAHLLAGGATAARGGRSGELATAAVQGVDALEAWFARYLPQVVLSAIVPPAILGYLAFHDLTATVVLAVTVPVLIVFMVLVGLAARERARRRWRALSVLGAHFADVVRGMPTLRAHARDGAQVSTLGAIAERYRRETMGTLRVAFLSAFVLELVAMLGTALVAATIGLQLVAGDLELRDGLLVLLLAPELYGPLRAVGQQFHASADGLAGAERILAVLDEPPALRPTGAAPAPDPRREPVVLDRVVVAHPGRPSPVLRGASLELLPGQTVALVGPSGAGKTTLASLVVRLLDPAEGSVCCGDVDLRDVDPAAWRARVAWVPQRPAIFAASLEENVRIARPGASDLELRDALARAGLADLVASLPQGLDTRIGDGGRALSAGEAQRVALARAFLRDADLVVLDEPTAHLDAATAADVDKAIVELCADRTALLVAHRPELAALADRVLELHDGRLLERRPALLEAA
jgi:ATP-binding cassette, subfamily C, bacterial CydD